MMRPAAAFIANIRKSETARLSLAMFISVAIHLTPFLSGLIHFAPQPAGRQIVLQATLQPLPDKPVAETTSPPKKKPEKKDVPAKSDKEPDQASLKKIMTGNSAMKIAPEKDKNQQQATDEPAKPEDREARLIEDPGAPNYPPEAIRRELESCVLAAVNVSASGEVETVTILHADVPGIFDQSVIEAQSAAHYLPAQRGGDALASRALAVVSFVLDPSRKRNCAMQYAAVAQQINRLPVDAAIPPVLLEGLPHAQ